jgi:ABC-type Fe3+-siderophore transport system permease subunit
MIPPIIATILSGINFVVFTTIIVRAWNSILRKLPTIPDDKERNKVFHKIQRTLQWYPFLGVLIASFLMWQGKFHQTPPKTVWIIIVVGVVLFSLLFGVLYVKTEKKYRVERAKPATSRGSRNGSEGLFLAISLGLLIYQILLLFLQ